MTTHIWLRAETNPNERRTPLTPEDAEKLVQQGVKVTVEKSGQRTFSDDLYQKVGCNLAEPSTWMNEAPLDTVVLGLGPLAGTFPLNHRHIYFGHAFKNQFGWRDLLTRFLQGGGALLDIEYIVNEQGHRLASFGNIAGYTGMAAGVLAWCRQELMEKSIQIPSDMIHQFETLPLLEHLKALLNTAVTFSRRTPNIVVIGANGIVGRGAISLAEQLGLPVTKWTREQTTAEGPYPELLQCDILLNAIKLDQQVRSPFLTEELIRSAGRQLSVVVDVSCDYQNPKNPLPIYHQPTTFDKPTLRVLDKPRPLDLIAIPTLPSLLPTESSKDFSKQLLPHLLTVGQVRNDVWTRVEGFFLEKIATISPVPLSRTQHPELHCTWHQERLWKLHQVDTSAYNIAKAVKLDKQVSLIQLSAVVSQLLSQSEILRTTFEFNAQKQRLMQAVQTTVDVTSVVSQVQSTHEPQSAEFQALLTHHIATPFNIERLPLVRVVLCQTASASVVLVVMHQIIADEQSLSLFVEKLFGKTAAGAGHHALQFGDYSHWDYTRWLTHSWARDEMSPTDEETWEQTQIHYWKEKLNGSLHVLQLPIDYPRPPVQGFDCVKSARALPLELTQKLRKFSERISSDSNNWNGLFIALLTAFKIVLYRFTLEEDIIVTTKFSGRTMAMYRQLLGTFANQLVLRTPVADNLSFQQLLEQVQQTFEQALAHRDVPFERVLEELYGKEEGGARIAHAPISQVQINLVTELEKTPLPERFSGEVASQAVNVEAVTLNAEKSPLDLTVTISGGERDDEPLKVELLYNKNLFFPARMEELHSQLELLLNQILANPSENIVNYNLVTERAKSALPAPEKAIDDTWRGAIFDHFSRNARANPDRVAVVYENKPITYGVLEKWTNKLSNHLISSGIKPEDVIAIYGHRSPPVVVAIMGILKAGAAYTMMDPIYPTERIQQCLDIAKPRGWVGIGAAGTLPSDLQEYLTSLNLLVQLALPAVDQLSNDAANPLAQAAETYPNVEVGPDSLAVVTFTSGSTGIPKGVMGRHVSLTHFYPWMSQRFEFGPDDRFSMCSGIAHDPLQRDIFTPLFFGAPVYIPTQETINEPGRLAEWMKENEINVTCMTPALGQLLTTVDNPSFTIDSLKNAFFVGDCLIKRDVYRLRRLCPNVRCINMYGSTETQRSVGYFVVPGDEILKDMKEVIPVGVGMQDVDLLILNSRGKLAGVGEAAEIYVRSHHLARGYIALEEQTKAKFLQNPFTNIPGDRMYRTGDLGRYASDGSLECMGRADDQVKIRGFRIELGEINAVLSKHPTVKENVTIVREDKPGDKQLVSYIVPTEFDRDGNKVSSIDIPSLCKELKQFLAGKLPHYMVPVHIVVLQTMPLTPNGKINRPGLPAPQKANSDLNDGTGTKSLRPLTEQEQALIQLWSKVLGVEVTNPDESFFELGGHSLLATRLTFEIRNEFQTELPMQLLFKAPTVTSMARAIERVKQGKPIEDEDLQKKERETQAQFLESEVATLLKDPELTLPSNIGAISTTFNNILLTGGTGFLGAFLLRDLLARAKDAKNSSFKVYCLVRAVNEEEAMVRLKNNLQGHLLWEDWYEPHIVALPGDLSKELLGLTSSVFTDLASKIDLIVHNGAYVHWLQPYDRLKATNVLGTLAVLKLASKTRLKPVHYVSTTSVYESDYHQNLKTVYEDDPFTANPLGLSGGYPQTKWVAEKLVLAARARGIPVSIYRPGYVSGDTVNGIWNTDDFICRLIKACIQLGAAPDLRAATLDMSPVDFVTESITNCAFDASALNKSFNVVNSNLYSFNKLFTSMHSFGYNVELVDYAVWRQKLVQATAAADNDNALSAMVTFFTESWADGLQNRPKTDNRNLQEARKNAAFPDIDNILLTYFSYLIQCGFIEPPLRAPNNNLNINWKIISDGVQMLTRTNRHK